MGKSLSILILIGIIALGVWVYKTRTPVALPPESLTGTATPVVPEKSPFPDAASTPGGGPETPPRSSELDRILSTLKGPDQRKLLILEEILKSKNDNDPRLDSEFRTMSPELKRAMTQYYKTIAEEHRNERGTIAFLYARAMTSPQDMELVTSVMMEKPCLSLSNCDRSEDPGHDHAHLEGVAETTAHYPQLTAVRQALERYNAARGESPPNEALANAIIEGYRRTANDGRNPRIQEEARQVLRYLGKQ